MSRRLEASKDTHSEIFGDVAEFDRPVHATSWFRIIEANIVHVNTHVNAVNPMASSVHKRTF